MELLKETKQVFRELKYDIVKAMQKLAQVYEEKAWESVASSWGEYVEAELGISQGFSSKLLSVNRHYLLEGGLSPRNIEGIDYEKLYLAAKTGGSVEEQIAKASTLTRSELKQDRQDAEPHAFESLEICKICHGSKENHS